MAQTERIEQQEQQAGEVKAKTATEVTHTSRASHALDMTSGVIWRQLVAFALPVALGMMFQQLYSTVDGLVVGNFVSANALGAVASVAVITWALISLLQGFSGGATVVVAQDFGARDLDGLTRSVHTATLGMILFSIVFGVLGVAVSAWLVLLLNLDEVLVADATTYLTIYCVGIPGLMTYSVGTGILRAVGDSRRPLYILIITSIINVVLDLLFVVVFDWAVAGAAWATVIAGYVSAILTYALLMRTHESYRVRLSKLRIDRAKLRKILAVGVPTGVQMGIISLSNVFVQAYVNGFGAAVTTGWGVDSRVDPFAILPAQALCMAATTFAGQNYGAGDIARIKQGTSTCRKLAIGSTLVVAALCIVFAAQITKLFTRDPEAQYYAIFFIILFCALDFINVFNMVEQCVLQGMGDVKIPTIICIGSFVVLRQIYLAIASACGASLLVITMGYPLGWFACSIFMHIYYKRSKTGRMIAAA